MPIRCAPCLSLLLGLALAWTPVHASKDPVQASGGLDEHGLEALMLAELETTVAGREAQPVTETATAVHALAADDMRRSGSTALPHESRFIPDLHVARDGACECMRVRPSDGLLPIDLETDASSGDTDTRATIEDTAPQNKANPRVNHDLVRHWDLDDAPFYVDGLANGGSPGYRRRELEFGNGILSSAGQVQSAFYAQLDRSR